MSSITETFFPNLLETLKEDPSAAERLDLDCGICLEKMTVNERIKVRATDDSVSVAHGAYILPCGHIFGFSCITELATRNGHAREDHKCPTCRHRLHFTPCHCPNNLGMPLNVNQDKLEEMLTTIEKVKTIRDHCFICGLKAFSTDLKNRLLVSRGIDVGVSGSMYRLAVMRPLMKMVFKKSVENGEWRIERFCVDGRRYWRVDIEPDICQRIDEFVDRLVDMHFAYDVEHDEVNWTKMQAEISEGEDYIQMKYW